MITHPAKFSPEVLSTLSQLTSEMEDGARVLDPFAGVGTIHNLTRFNTVGVEMEPEWATQHKRTIVGDSRFLAQLLEPESFDAVITSCSYANRMSDRYAGDPKGSRRFTYRISLGRPLSEGNGAAVQWSGSQKKEYQAIHETVWEQCFQVLKPGGLLLLNVSDHIRGGEVMPVVAWHSKTLESVGFKLIAEHSVKTRRMRMGANREKRVPTEMVLVASKPSS